MEIKTGIHMKQLIIIIFLDILKLFFPLLNENKLNVSLEMEK